MDDVYEAAGSYLVLYTRDSGCCRVAMEDDTALDVAVSRYIDSGRQRDELLHLTTVEGAVYRVLASEVTSWLASTPETRRRADVLEAALNAEKPAEWERDDD